QLDVEESLVESDIKHFLSQKLKGSINADQIAKLAKMSGKLFIFAATLVKWITMNPNFHGDRLKVALHLDHTLNKKEIGALNALDELYSSVINNSMGTSNMREKEEFLKVLHTVITVSNPVSCKVIAQLSDLEVGQVETFIRSLGSVLYVSGENNAVYSFHASFSDYLFEEARANSIHCLKQQHHTLLSKQCLEIMNKKLKFNMLNLPSSFLPDNEIAGIETKVKNEIDECLVYVCKAWVYHFVESTKDTEVLSNFINSAEVVHWVEAMSLLRIGRDKEGGTKNSLAQCVEMLNDLQKIFSSLPKLQENIINLKAAVEIFLLSVVNGMTPHWYLSILPWWSKKLKATQKMIMGVGVVKQVERIIIAVWDVQSAVSSLSISPNGEEIVYGSNDKTVRIWNAKTGEAIGKPLEGHTHCVNSVAFSPDGERIVSGS
ncbi:hypothetical protein BT96DRAFT_1057731, partial [Gymnopus androsaceus JB14]